MRLSRTLAITCAAAAAIGGCGGPGESTGPRTIYTLSVRSGDGQTGPAGSLLDEPLQVTVRDPANTPAKGVQVRFRLVGGRGGQLVDSLAATGTDGVARAQLRVGSERDSAVILAAVPGQEDRGVTFRAVATAGAVLTSVTPSRLAPGDTVALRGLRFNSSPAGNSVYFGPSRARVISAAGDSVLRVVVPPCLAAGSVPVVVRLGSAATNSVAATVSGVGAPLRLAAFEAVTVSGTEAGSCLVLAPGTRYLLVPQLASVGDSVPSARAYTLGIDSAITPTIGAADLTAPLASRPSRVREHFERFLRGEERRVGRELRGSGAPQPRLTRAAADAAADAAPDPPAIGSTRSFRVLSRLGRPTAFTSVTARLRYAGANILIYEDRTAPEPLSDDALRRLGDHFDQTLYPIDVATFGAESDIDGNGRVIVLMTPIVNALTPSTRCASEGFVPGFFYSLDLGTRDRNSNRGEIFYAFVPDPRAERSCTHSVAEVMRLLPSVFLHEFQHAISFNQHVLVRRGSEEDVWLNEGLSHYAEELGARYYDARFPAPGGRTNPTALLPDSALSFMRGNLENAAGYLASPSTSSVTTYTEFGTLEERGAAWLFVRWLASQKGDGVIARLVQTSRTSRRNVEEVTGETFAGLFGDFGIALYADSVPGIARTRIPARYRFTGRSLRELFARVEARPRYPLTVRGGPAVGAQVTGSLVQGTFEYFDVSVTRPGGVAVRFSAPGGAAFPANAEAQLGVLRLTP